MKILCTDPKEGLFVITKEKTVYHTRFGGESVGKVKYLSYNLNKKWIAIYSDSESYGNVIVLMDMNERGRQSTNQLGATGVTIGGSKEIFIVLKMAESICVVGPNTSVLVDFKSEAAGIFTAPEIDGLRISTSSKTFFVELVQQSTQDTFTLGSIEPSAKLLQAQKWADFKSAKSEEIITDLGPDLTSGIKTLLDAAKYEHNDIDILKHILRTASYAKKFSDTSEVDPKEYVNLVQLSIFLKAMRNSPTFARAITHAEFDKSGAKNIVKILLKYNDF